MAEQSKGAVLLALGANALIAVAKLVGGLLTGSAAMFSEAAHSVADTLNEGFLLTSLVRSRRAPDAVHPFGYGKERFFWSLLAAMGIFVAGAGFSLIEAWHSFTHEEKTGGSYFLVAYLILGVCFAAEFASWLRAVRQLRAEAREADRSMTQHVRASADPSVKTVASEDTAALVGLAFAAAGVVLHQVTGRGWWEGVASLLIAALLVVVAFALARDTKGLLIGEAADPRLLEDVRRFLRHECAEIDDVLDVLTMRIGADQVLLAAHVDLASDLDSDRLERASTEIDRELKRRWPEISHVFLDATATPAGPGGEAPDFRKSHRRSIDLR